MKIDIKGWVALYTRSGVIADTTLYKTAMDAVTKNASRAVRACRANLSFDDKPKRGGKDGGA
jgi:hypothetical protein